MDEIYQFDAKTITNFNENIDSINEFLNMSLHQKKTVLIYLKSFQIQNFVKFLNCPNILTSEDDIHPQMVNIIASERNHGYLYRDFVILTDKDLFKIQETKHVYKTKFKYASKIKDINKLQIGDYIVHNVHGIGVYNGIRTLTKMGLEKDYLEILYAGKDKLYIPVEKIDLISKYSGNEGMVPKINRLGGSEWAKTKLRVRNKVKDIALVILDVMMPKMDGWEVCREIRKDSKVPIIMLTARGDERDELLGFELGVDEYISKPFSPKILVARVEAILRRTNARGTEDILQAGGIEINKSAHIAAIDGDPMELSYKEFELLTYFMENQGIALSREKILNSVWNYDYFGDARTIDTHVKKLRSKMGKKGEYIKTIWGMGYKFEV